MTRYKRKKDSINVVGSNGANVSLQDLSNEKHKVYIKFNVGLLNAIIGLIMNMDKPYINFKVIKTIYDLFNKLDKEAFVTDDKLNTRYLFIKFILNKVVAERALMTEMSLDLFIEDTFRTPVFNELKSCLPALKNIDEATCNNVFKAVQERLNYIYLHIYKDAIVNLFQKLNDDAFNSYKEINDELRAVISMLMTNMKRADGLSSVSTSLSLTDDFDEAVLEALRKLRDNKRELKTGMKMFNKMLGGGMKGGTLNIGLALPGIGKTFTMVKTMLDFKMYNKQIKANNPGYKPTVLFISLEDTIEQLVSRMFSMLVKDGRIEDDSLTETQLLELLKTKGGMNFESDEINIELRYYPVRSIDTSDLYGIIEELKDEKKEVIALIVDYIKRIKPAEFATEERDEIKNITNELRTIAIFYDMPVFTCHQLNRSAMESVNKALEGKKDNVTGTINVSQVGGSVTIVENADFLFSIMKETDSDGQQYMVYKKLKIRYKDIYNIDQFAQPYDEGNDRLIDDIYLPDDETKSIPYVSKRGMAMDMVAINRQNKVPVSVGDEEDDIFMTSRAIN